MSDPTIFERLVRGEVTAEEYVADLKRRVREHRREYKRGRGPSTGSQPESKTEAVNQKGAPDVG